MTDIYEGVYARGPDGAYRCLCCGQPVDYGYVCENECGYKLQQDPEYVPSWLRDDDGADEGTEDDDDDELGAGFWRADA